MKMRLFERAKNIFKMLSASWFFVYFFEKFSSIVDVNMGLVDQRVLKLIAVKVRVLKKKSAARPGPTQTSRAGFDSNWGQIFLKVWRMVTLQPFDLPTLYLQDQKIYTLLRGI